MRISTKLALTSSFVIAIAMSGTARADESNQTKINLNIPQNILTIDQTAVCASGDITPQVPAAKELKTEEVKKEDQTSIEIKKVPNTGNLPDGKFMINASAYTAAADECGKSDGVTASGAKVRENETIACPKSFAFGTKISIEGYGTYICQDRGGAIKGNHIDIYMETKAKAFAFGRRNLVAEIVE